MIANQTYYCKNCGSEIDPKGRFCETCGQPIALTPPPQTAPAPPAAPLPATRPALKPISLVLGIGAFLGIMACCCLTIVGVIILLYPNLASIPASQRLATQPPQALVSTQTSQPEQAKLPTQTNQLSPTKLPTKTSPPLPTQVPSPKPGKDEEFFKQWSTAAVSNGVGAPTMFTIDEAWMVTEIVTYHWNDGKGQKPGTIRLEAGDGTIYGPWQSTGMPGQGGLANAAWIVNPNIVIPADTYILSDSDPDTWSQNVDTGHAGMSWGKGIRQGNP